MTAVERRIQPMSPLVQLPAVDLHRPLTPFEQLTRLLTDGQHIFEPQDEVTPGLVTFDLVNTSTKLSENVFLTLNTTADDVLQGYTVTVGNEFAIAVTPGNTPQAAKVQMRRAQQAEWEDIHEDQDANHIQIRRTVSHIANILQRERHFDISVQNFLPHEPRAENLW